jgi:hypothetical protein
MARTYNPENVTASFNGYEIGGYAEDEFINVTYNGDAATPVVGNDGAVSRAMNPDKSGTITITLKATSPSNDVLSGFAIKDRIDGSVVGVLMIRDNNGTTLVLGKDAWIQKQPDVAFAREVGNRAWMFAVGTMTEFVGSNPET